MRVVEYTKKTESVSYRTLQAVGIVAGIFSLVVCLLMIANNLSLKQADPIHSPALLKLLEELKASPQDEAIREEIRELDYLTRRAFFTSQHFNRTAIYLLVGGLVVMVLAFKTLESYKGSVPYPDSKTPKEDLIGNAKWARKSVTAAGLVLFGFALILALPWKSALDEAEPEPGVLPGAGTTLEATKEEATSVQAPAAVVASREEMLKNWPAFRGANNGLIANVETPIDWDGESGRGVTWKTEVPKPGFSSPIIWNNRLFLSGGDKDIREVYCFDTEKGELLWRHAVTDIPQSPAKAPKVNRDTGYAAATMATDGTRVFAIFATGDLVALDFEGNRLWGRNLGVPDNPYGHSSSLGLFEDILLVQFDHKDGGALFGLAVDTGDTRWKTPRDFGTSWASPLVIDTGESNEVVLSADPFVVSYDAKTGNELWRVKCLEGGEVAPTPIFADGVVYVACDYVKVAAIDVKTHTIVWENEELIPGVSSPLVVGDLLIGGLSDGGIVCYQAKTGEELWFEETDEGFYASPVLAGEQVYLMDRSGMMHILAASSEFKSFGNPLLGEEAVCTPAVMGNTIYYRGTKHLFRIES